jgi:catechol 2,3-dioxygenase-like lactoylglutathione lyase family enzyme
MSLTTSRIGRIHLVTIPSADPERSIAFYLALGFEKRSDVPFGDGHRWVELFPPDGSAGIALAPAEAGAPGVQTGMILVCDDIDATHAELRAGGVDVDAAIARPGAPTEIRIGAAELVGPTPPMFYFRDPDGNALMVVQPD